jgi:hypothetical protein
MRPSPAWRNLGRRGMDHDHPLKFGWSLVSEARDPPRLVETARRWAGVDPDDATVCDEKTVEGYLG